MSEYNYLDQLNSQQRDAVSYCDGPQLVIAGAGSGKTRVLTYKIVHLLRLGIEPWRILALTFTNKAAREMKERITSIVGDKIASRLWMGTFHSIFLRILRRHAEKIGFDPRFTIYDANESKSLIKMIIKERGYDDKTYKINTVASAISNAKNALVLPDMYISNPEYFEADSKAHRPAIGKIYKLYTERCRIAQAMDFDDILVYMNILLRDFPEIASEYGEFFKYILVDEYQDTNFSQHLIIKALSSRRSRLCVVGDDAQSIYSFRGANIANILHLKEQIPELKIFKLERNYRSTRNIVDAAGSLIKKNRDQMPKNVFSENEEGEKIKVIRTYSDMEEAYLLANMIEERRLRCQESLDGFAVLYRTNAQSRILEECLRKKNIPYRIYGGLSFYQRKEIKDATCYFRLAVNPKDDEALRRVINFPARGIGDTTMKKLIAGATDAGVSIWEVIGAPDSYGVAVNGGTKRKLDGFRQMISEFIAAVAGGMDAYEVGQLIINRTGLLSSLAHDNTPESISRQENLVELLTGMKEFVEMRREAGDEDLGITDFLSEVSLATDQDEQDNVDGPKVTLMTVHAAKGLEFNHVFIVGVEEELFPSSMSMNSPKAIEEERRLLYVAITRAMKTCTMTYAGTRFRNGQTLFTRPSRFLSDIDRKFIDSTNSIDFNFDSSRRLSDAVNNYSGSYGIRTGKEFSGISTSTRAAKKKSKSFSFDATGAQEIKTSVNGLCAGKRVSHNRFGVGVVRKIESVSGSEVVTIDFGVTGVKKILLKYAKLSILD